MFGAFSDRTNRHYRFWTRRSTQASAQGVHPRHVCVSPAFRHQGIGRQLISQVLQHAASVSGLRQVTLPVTASNPAAIALYEKIGFTSYGLEPAALLVNGEFHDEIYMVRFVEQS